VRDLVVNSVDLILTQVCRQGRGLLW